MRDGGPEPLPGPLTNAVPVAAFAAFVALAAYLVATKVYPSPFDELEHVAYAAFLQETHAWRPMFEAMRDLVPTSLVQWDTRPNYLGHPSPFYWYETLFLDRSLPLHEAVTRVRLASAGLVAAGIGLSVWAGWRVFSRDRLALCVFCGLVALCPKLLAVTGQVTNDALALLAGGVAYWGATQEARRRVPGLVACGLGLLLAFWAKPNAVLAIGGVLGLYALFRVRTRPSLTAALAVGAAVGVVPYVLIVAKYGALVPVTVEQFGQVHQVPGLEYLAVFFVTVAYTFCFDQAGVWPLPGWPGLATALLVWALLGAMVAGGWVALRRGAAADPDRSIAVAAALAFLAVMPVHLWFSATKLGGSLPAASFRYYLPIWPFMAHALGYGMGRVGGPVRVGVAALAVAAVGVGWASP